MKLILTLCAALCGATMMAGDLGFEVRQGTEGQAIANGAVIEVGYEKAADMPRYVWDPDLYLVGTAETTDVEMTLTSSETDPGVSWQCCGPESVDAMGGCVMVPAGKPLEKKLFLDKGDALPLQIDIAGFFAGDLPKESTLTCKFVSEGGEMTITLKTVNSPKEEPAGGGDADGLGFEVRQGAEGPAIANGAVVEVGYEKAADMPRYVWDPDLYLVGTAETTDVEMTLTSSETDPGVSWQCCGPESVDAMGGCVMVPAGKPLEKMLYLDKGDALPLQIDIAGFFAGDLPKESTLTCKFVSEGGEMTITLQTVNKSKEELGVANVAADRGTLKVLGRTVDYDFAVLTAVNFYSVDGRAAASFRVAGQGSLNLSMPAGIYVYRAGRACGKVIVR